MIKPKVGSPRLCYISLLLSSLLLVVGCIPKTQDSTQTIRYVVAEQAFNIIQDNEGNPDFIILDVRTSEEFVSGHIANAIMIDFYSEDFRDEIEKLDKDDTYLLYCRSGNRSREALSVMLELGFTDIYHLYTGIIEWIDKGFPIVK